MTAYIGKINASLQSKTGDSNQFLVEVAKQWKKYTLFIKCLSQVFMYLNQYYLKGMGHESVVSTALTMYRDMIFKRHLERLRTCVLAEI